MSPNKIVLKGVKVMGTVVFTLPAPDRDDFNEKIDAVLIVASLLGINIEVERTENIY